jgi:hypothetical protein
VPQFSLSASPCLALSVCKIFHFDILLLTNDGIRQDSWRVAGCQAGLCARNIINPERAHGPVAWLVREHQLGVCFFAKATGGKSLRTTREGDCTQWIFTILGHGHVVSQSMVCAILHCSYWLMPSRVAGKLIIGGQCSFLNMFTVWAFIDL